jgi:hypothetical protein
MFVGNFQGTYVRPGNSWDLRSCTQKPGESLWDFIRRFSKRCTELPSVAQSEIVHAFLEGTTCRDLVRELGRSPPVDSNELFDIATSFASGEEVVGAIFNGKKGKRVDNAPVEALALDEALVANMEKMVNEDLDSSAKHAGSFEAAEQTKEVPLDPAAPEGKALRVSSTLDPK